MKIEPYDGRHDLQIESLVEAIRYKAAVHSNKGQWDDVPLSKLIQGLKGEVAELEEAISRMNVLDATLECGDIALYAVMILETLQRSRCLKPLASVTHVERQPFAAPNFREQCDGI